MKTYYLFNINNEIFNLTKDYGYMLFKDFETIHKTEKDDYNVAFSAYQSLTSKFDKEKINNLITNNFSDNKFYHFEKPVHYYYNKYLDETCNVLVKNAFAICKCNTNKFELLKNIKDYNIFACDFENKNYFWLNEIYC